MYQSLAPGSLGAGSTRGSVEGTIPGNALHWQFDYDGDGNQTSVTDPKNQTTSMMYDYLDRLQTVTYSNPAQPNLDYQPVSIVYGYDGNGNILSVTEKKMVQGAVCPADGFVYLRQIQQDEDGHQLQHDRVVHLRRPGQQNLHYLPGRYHRHLPLRRPGTSEHCRNAGGQHAVWLLARQPAQVRPVSQWSRRGF